MRRAAAITILLFFSMSVGAAECVGPKPSAGFLWIVFDCKGVRSADVHWFNPKGAYRNQFAVTTTDVVIKSPTNMGAIKPPEIPMSFDGGGDCVSGAAVTHEGRCVARYELPCARQLYRLDVQVDPQPEQGSYSVLRSIRRKERPSRCDRPNVTVRADTIFSDSERITVTVFAQKPAAALFQTDINLERVSDTWMETWDRNKQKELVESEYGQGRAAVSENARWIAAATAQQVGVVRIEVKKAQP